MIIDFLNRKKAEQQREIKRKCRKEKYFAEAVKSPSERSGREKKTKKEDLKVIERKGRLEEHLIIIHFSDIFQTDKAILKCHYEDLEGRLCLMDELWTVCFEAREMGCL